MSTIERSAASQSQEELKWLLQLLWEIRQAQGAKGDGDYNGAVTHARKAKTLWEHEHELKGPLQYVLDVDPIVLCSEYQELQEASDARTRAESSLREGIRAACSGLLENALKHFKEGLQATYWLAQQEPDSAQQGQEETQAAPLSPSLLRACFSEARHIVEDWQKYIKVSSTEPEGAGPASPIVRILYLAEWKRGCDDKEAEKLRQGFVGRQLFDEFLGAWKWEQDRLRAEVLELIARLLPCQSSIREEGQSTSELISDDWIVLDYYYERFGDDSGFKSEIRRFIQQCQDSSRERLVEGEMRKPDERGKAPAEGAKLASIMQQLQEAQTWADCAARLESVLGAKEYDVGRLCEDVRQQIETFQEWKEKWDRLCEEFQQGLKDDLPEEEISQVVEQAKSFGWEYVWIESIEVSRLDTWCQKMKDSRRRLCDARTAWDEFSTGIEKDVEQGGQLFDKCRRAIQDQKRCQQSIPEFHDEGLDEVEMSIDRESCLLVEDISNTLQQKYNEASGRFDDAYRLYSNVGGLTPRDILKRIQENSEEATKALRKAERFLGWLEVLAQEYPITARERVKQLREDWKANKQRHSNYRQIQIESIRQAAKACYECAGQLPRPEQDELHAFIHLLRTIHDNLARETSEG